MPAKAILLAVTGFNPQRWHELLSARREVVLEPDGPADPSIAYAVVWKQRPRLLVAAAQSQGDLFDRRRRRSYLRSIRHLPDVPIVRVVADNLTQHMTEYVVWRVLDHHRQGMLYRAQQERKVWHEPPQPAGRRLAVGIMGLGELGRAARRPAALLRASASMAGAARRRTLTGVATFHGEDGLASLPQRHRHPGGAAAADASDAGHHRLRAVCGQLRRDNALGGAVLINAGRGQLQMDADILARSRTAR